MAESTSEKSRSSRVISRVLPSAIRLWLHTQLEQVDALDLSIEGRDRDILSGYVQAVFLSAQKAIYQGLHLSQIAVEATDIRINLGQVIRRKPLRLLTPFPLSGDLCLTAADLNASLQSALLGEGLYKFLRLIARSQPEVGDLDAIVRAMSDNTVSPHYQVQATIEMDCVVLEFIPRARQAVPPLLISTQLKVREGNHLCLENPRWQSSARATTTTPLSALHGFEINLGSEVRLTKCEVQSGQLVVSGTIQVLPTEPSAT